MIIMAFNTIKLQQVFHLHKVSHVRAITKTHRVTRSRVSRASSGVIDQYRLQLTRLQGFVKVLQK